MYTTIVLTFFVLCTVLCVTADDNRLRQIPNNDTIVSMFKKYNIKYHKKHNDVKQYQRSFSAFRKNLAKVVRLNNLNAGTAVYGLTKFSGMTSQEVQTVLGLKMVIQPISNAVVPAVTNYANAFDWRTYNVVSPVKDQGYCGSCWAFCVTGAIESQYAMKYGAMQLFSEQQLVDCDTLNYGCDGGWPAYAMQAITQMGGLANDTTYPYEGVDQTCQFNTSQARVNVAYPLSLSTNETQILQYLYVNGPVTAAINADDMILYESGISHPSVQDCDPNGLNHAVLIVGYGTAPIPYWIVKNQWNTDWGEAGYYRIYRGDNSCGIASNVVAVVIQ